MEQPCLVIADCHGHLDRLEGLLRQEGIIATCPECLGTGDLYDDLCFRCKGDGVTRINHDVTVVQLGDLGHFGSTYNNFGQMVPGSSIADELIYTYGPDWIDIILWGNHDRALIDPRHAFTGFIPNHPVRHKVLLLRHEGKMRLAYAAHGFLITHAGLHRAFRHQDVPKEYKINPVALADWLNALDRKELPGEAAYGRSFVAIRDADSAHRGGLSPAGGILWRDASESLYQDTFRQVFGHTKKDKVRRYQSPQGVSYCIDVGSEHNGRLAAIWLPEERVVEVNMLKESSGRPNYH